MGDVIEGKGLDRVRKEVDLLNLIVSLKRMELRLAEMEDEKKRILENYQATQVAIKRLREELGLTGEGVMLDG